MKNNKITINTLCFLLCLVLMTGVFAGCSPSINDTSSKQSSSQIVSSEDSSTESISSDGQTSTESSDYSDDIDVGDTDVSDPSQIYEKLLINNKTPLCKDFMGFNTVYSAFTYMPDKFGRQYSEAQAKLELDRVADMGINTVRTYYSSEWAWDAETNSWNWDSPKMKGFWRWLSEMQNRKIDVALAALWQLAALERNTDISFQMPGIYVDGDLDATLKNYAKFMADTLNQASERGFNNIKYLILFTEPNNSHVTNPGYVRDEPRSYQLYAKATRALDKGLKDASIRNKYKLVGTNDNIDDTYSYFLDHAVKELNDCIDIFSSHASYAYAKEIVYDEYYDNMTYMYADRLSWVKPTGKPFWIDEINVKTTNGMGLNEVVNIPWSGTQRAVIYSAAMNMGMQNLFLWTVCDQLWPDTTTTNSDSFTNGVQKLGLMPSLFETTIPRASYYGFSLLSKYTGYGTTYEGVTENYGNGLYISCEQRKDGNWTVIVSNAGYFDANIEVKFEKFIGKTLYRHVYNPNTVKPTTQARMIPADKIFRNVKNKFYDTILSGGVAVYTSVKD